MHTLHQYLSPALWLRRLRAVGLIWSGVLLAQGLTGCAALTNPVGNGVPVRDLPPEVLGKPRDLEQTIPMTLLGQRIPEVYRLGPGDTLGVWIETILGDQNVPPPVHIP